EEVVGPENVAQARGRLERRLRLLHLQGTGHLALQAAAQADEPLRVLREQLPIDARPVVETLGVPRRDQPDQVLVALVGLRQQYEMVRLRLRTALVEPAARR